MQAVRANVAYDLSRFDNRMVVREQVKAERDGAKAKAKGKKADKAKAKPAVSGFAVFSFLVAMAMIMCTLFSYVQLTELSDSAMQMKKELATLREENQMLQIEIDHKYSAEKIKEEAVDRLGMQKLDKSQITYLNMGSGNRVEIPQETQVLRDSQFIAGIVDGFRWIVEYIN